MPPARDGMNEHDRRVIGFERQSRFGCKPAQAEVRARQDGRLPLSAFLSRASCAHDLRYIHRYMTRGETVIDATHLVNACSCRSNGGHCRRFLCAVFVSRIAAKRNPPAPFKGQTVMDWAVIAIIGVLAVATFMVLAKGQRS